MVDVRQSIDRDTLTQICEASNKLGDYLFRAADSEVTYPVRIRANNPASHVVLVENVFITNPDHSRRRTIYPINGMVSVFSGGTITVPVSSGGSLVPSVGSSVVLTLASGYNANIGVGIDGSGNIVISVGTASNSTPNLYAPSVPQGSRIVGFFNVQNIAGTIQSVTNASIVQYHSVPPSSTEGAVFVKWGSTVISTPYAVSASDYVIPVDTTGFVAPMVVNLPSISLLQQGRQIIVKDVGGNLSKTNQYATITPSGTDKIEGVVGQTIRMDLDRMSLTFVCDGISSWYII